MIVLGMLNDYMNAKMIVMRMLKWLIGMLNVCYGDVKWL